MTLTWRPSKVALCVAPADDQFSVQWPCVKWLLWAYGLTAEAALSRGWSWIWILFSELIRKKKKEKWCFTRFYCWVSQMPPLQVIFGTKLQVKLLVLDFWDPEDCPKPSQHYLRTRSAFLLSIESLWFMNTLN